MGDEAAFEPRPWKMPWQSTLFDSVLEASLLRPVPFPVSSFFSLMQETRYMVATLAAIETSFAEDGVEGAKWLASVCSAPRSSELAVASTLG